MPNKEQDTKITRLRNLLTPVKNYFALLDHEAKNEEAKEKFLKKELKQIKKVLPEIWEIIKEIPNDAIKE